MNPDNYIHSASDSNFNDFFDIRGTNTLFTLLYTNIRSVRHNFNNFIAEINCLKVKPHLIVLSEIWVDSNEVDLYKISGYTIFHKCNDDYRAGGVVCYADLSISVNELYVNMSTADALLLDIKLNNNYFKLICLYRLQFYSVNCFLDELSQLILSLNNNVVYVGDLNLNIAINNSISQKYLSLLSNNGFVSLINSPTRITDSSKTCIDHIFIRSKHSNAFQTSIFDIGLTDHCFLGLKESSFIFSNVRTPSNDSTLNLNKKTIDFDLLKEQLRQVDWDPLYVMDDVDLCYDTFIQIMDEVIRNSTKTVNCNNKLYKAKLISPWITNCILDKINKRKKLYKISKRRPYDSNFNSYFKNFCTNLKLQIDTTKNNFFQKQLEACAGDSSQQWKIINNLTGSSSNKSVQKVEVDNGDLVTEPKVVARVINEYFVRVQEELVTDNTQLTHTSTPLHTAAKSFFILPVTLPELINTVNSLKNKKSTGFDNINVYVVKKSLEIIAPVLVHIFNLSFSTGVFPTKLKSSKIIPLLKKGNSSKLDNLRPITLLSVFSKLIEKLMLSRLLSFLNSQSFFSSKQFGFTKGKSTEDALITFTNRLYNSINANYKSTGLFIDFKKAFDLVDHDILLLKLEAAGTRGTALNWFDSFLSNRTQRVVINNSLSPPLTTMKGVPQGSVTAATLFLIFINDLLNTNFNGNISAFADDVSLLYSSKDIMTITEYISHDLLILRDWCKINKMKVNVEKTKYINFDLRGFMLPFQIKYHSPNCDLYLRNCQTIEKVSHIKYLGLILDENLNWDKHISCLHTKLRSSIRKFYYLRNICNSSLLRMLYFALINSRLQYGICCYGGTYKTFVQKLRTTQNYYLRVILKKTKRESSFPLYQQLKILPFQHLFVFKVLKLFYVRSGNREEQNFYYNTRNAMDGLFRLPKVNKNIFRHSFEYLGPKFFNSLPPPIKTSQNNKSFCKLLKDWLLTQRDIDFLNVIIN